MSTTDEVIGSIDHALRDFDTSDDAMRWTPEPAPPRPAAPMPQFRPPSFARVVIRIDTAPFQAAMRSIMQAYQDAFRSLFRKVRDLLLQDQVNERRSQMHSAYRARARRRTRSKR